MAVTIYVHDARPGRDESRVDPQTGWGELLATFERARPYDLGDRLELPDGSEVVVVADAEQTSTASVEQHVHVSDSSS
jgi:hypothetical protein